MKQLGWQLERLVVELSTFWWEDQSIDHCINTSIFNLVLIISSKHRNQFFRKFFNHTFIEIQWIILQLSETQITMWMPVPGQSGEVGKKRFSLIKDLAGHCSNGNYRHFGPSLCRSNLVLFYLNGLKMSTRFHLVTLTDIFIQPLCSIYNQSGVALQVAQEVVLFSKSDWLSNVSFTWAQVCKGSIDPFVSNITDADADLVIIPFDFGYFSSLWYLKS